MKYFHSPIVAEAIAVVVVFLIEMLAAFLVGFTLFDTFSTWGVIPQAIVGGFSGLVFFLLELYVFIFREYAREAFRRYTDTPGGLFAWSTFLVFLCLGIATMFNINRMVALALPLDQKWYIGIAVEGLIFVPLALGKVTHAHVNAPDVSNKNVTVSNKNVPFGNGGANGQGSPTSRQSTTGSTKTGA